MSVSTHVMAPSIPARAVHFVGSAYRFLDFLAPVADLMVRLWVAMVFLKAGLSKFQSFETTVQLFTYEYQVPLLSPYMAAVLGTGTELIFPALLALGLAGRFSAIVLFVFNIVAVVSYPDLMGPGIRDHQVWGILLLVTVCHGPGRLSLDYLIARVMRRRSFYPV